jgi:hypothetical protein
MGLSMLSRCQKIQPGITFSAFMLSHLTTGVDLFGGPTTIQASYPGTGANSSGGNVVFDPKQYAERAGLLLLNGMVYTTWTSHCDIGPYTGWVMGFDATNLSQTNVLNLTPNGSEGAGSCGL